MKLMFSRVLFLGLFLLSHSLYSQTLTIAIKDTTVAKGAAFCSDIRVTNFTNIIGAQLDLNYNPQKLTYSKVQGFHPSVNGLSGVFNNIVASDNKSAKLKMAWFDDQLKGVTVPAGGTLFQVCFTAVNADARDTLKVNNTEIINLTETALPTSVNAPVIVIGAGGTGGGGTGGGGTGGGGSSGSTGNLILDIEDKTVAKGESFCLNVNARNFTKIVGMEFTMNYNANLLTFSSLRSFNVPGLDTAQFGMPGRGTNPLGKIKCSWFDIEAKGVTLADNLSIFQVCFTAKQTDGTTNITFDAGSEIIDSSNKEVVFEGIQGRVVIGAGGSTTSDNFRLTVGNASVGFGSEVCVPVSADGFKDIIGLQFRMNYDSTKLLFKSVRNFNSTLASGGFEESAFGKPGEGLNKAGSLILGWFDSRSQKTTLPDGTTLFELCFTARDSSGNTSVSIPTSGEIINDNNQLLPYTTQSGVITLGKPGSGGGAVNGPTFKVTGGSVEANEPICIDISATSFNRISAAQFTLTYDAAQLRFDSVTRFGLQGLNISSFGLPGQGSNVAGNIKMTWVSSDTKGITVANNTVLFKACFTAQGSGAVPIRFNKSNFEVLDSAQKKLTPGFTDGEIFIEGLVNTTDFTVKVGDATGVVGDKVCMPVSVLNFKDILGMEYTLAYDPVRLKFDTISDFNLVGLNESQFGLPGTGTNLPGKIKLSWLDPNVAGVSVPNNTVIFKLCFLILSENGSSRVTHDPTATTEILNKNETAIPYQFIPGTVRAGNLIPPVIEPGATIKSVNCFGSSTGGVTITVSGGTGSFTYKWSNGATSKNLANAPKGTYTVTVTNVGNPLTATATFVVPGPDSALVSVVTKFDAGCANQELGTLRAVVSGGRKPYTYNWSGGLASLAEIKNVPLGTYQLTLTDSLGCSIVSAAQTVKQSTLSLAVQKVDAICLGKNTGSIALTATGGEGAYTYLWDKNLPASANQSSLAPGNYQVTLSDTSGCTLFRAITIGQTDGISITAIQPTYVSNGNDGAIDLTVQGTKGLATFNWTGPGSYTATTKNISNLDTGTYCLIVRDTTSCRAEVCVKIVRKLQFAPAVVVNPCEGSRNGAVTLSLSGGVAPISYKWSSGQLTQNITGLGPGNYSVTATDAQNATLSLSVTLTEQSKPRVTPTITHVTGSPSNNNGQIALSVVGGTPPYTFLWSNGATTSTIETLVTGRYCVKVSDNAFCPVDTCFDIEYKIVPLAVNISTTGVLCPNDTTGKARVVISGGTSPYKLTLTLSGRVFNTLNGILNLENLKGGQINYVVEDAINTRREGSFTISTPTPFTVEPTVKHDNEESGCTGRIVLSISGGTAAYTVNWNTNNTGLQIISLCEGSYTPTIKDANGCTFTGAPIFVNTFSAKPTITKSDCPEDLNGSVILDVQGGKTPYRYKWLNSKGDTISSSKDLVDVMSGIYTLIISEASGNELTRNYNVEAKNILTATVKANTNYNGFVVSCLSNKDGVLEVTARNNSGSTSFVYEWLLNGSLASSAALFQNAGAGVYQVKITDPLGCTITRQIDATAPSRVDINASVIDIGCPAARNGSIVVSASGGVPGSTYVYVWNNGVRGPSLNLIPQGTYSISVEDKNNCKYTQTYTLRDPTPIVVTMKATPTLDDKKCDGKIVASATGGFPPYFYSWPQLPGVKDSFVLNLCPGIYGLQLTDSRGCAPNPAISTVEVNDERFECLEYRKLITPDGDGLNEEFIINCVTFNPAYQNNHLRIFNRFGQLVLDKKGYRNDWKGTTLNGDLLPQGVYYFTLDFNGEKPLEGSVTLLREN
jgi:gliding motility-associated-like protein